MSLMCTLAGLQHMLALSLIAPHKFQLLFLLIFHLVLPDSLYSGANIPDNPPYFENRDKLQWFLPTHNTGRSAEHFGTLVSRPVRQHSDILATYRIPSTRKGKRPFSELDNADCQSYQGVHKQPCKRKCLHICGPEHVKFEARLKHNSKQLNLGQYDTAEEAADVYLIACLYYGRLDTAKENELRALLGSLLPTLKPFDDDKGKEEWVKEKAEEFLKAYGSPTSATWEARRKPRIPVQSRAPEDVTLQDIGDIDCSEFDIDYEVDDSGIGPSGTTSHKFQGDLHGPIAGSELPATRVPRGVECRGRSSTDHATQTGAPVTTYLETSGSITLASSPITSCPREELAVVLGSCVPATPPPRPLDESISHTEPQTLVANGQPSNSPRAPILRFTPPIRSAMNEITEQRWELSVFDSSTVILVPRLEEGFPTKLVMTATMVCCFDEILRQGREISLEFTVNGENFTKFPVTSKTLSTCVDVLQEGLKPLSLECPSEGHVMPQATHLPSAF